MTTRRFFIRSLASATVIPFIAGKPIQANTLMKRTIPSTGEPIASVGVGTWQTFDVRTEKEKSGLKEVLSALVREGGNVIDSSPMYGQSEEIAGTLSVSAGINEKLFIATKVWTTGRDAGTRQIAHSFNALRHIDLLQIHNLIDWKTHLPTLRSLKDQRRIRYIGLTHYTDNAHDMLAEIIQKEDIDFVQVNYNLIDRHAAEKLLPLAQERNVAVIINRPFEEGALFQRVNGKELPPWASDFECTSWAQFFLKFILANPAVTCVIPGTGKISHLVDNLAAGRGKLPDENQLKQMIRLFE
jgi:aryl-alcohol dehydrogenase-like predicted oxidoreductase